MQPLNLSAKHNDLMNYLEPVRITNIQQISLKNLRKMVINLP